MANYPVPYVPRNLGLIFNLTEIQSLRSLNTENLGILWDIIHKYYEGTAGGKSLSHNTSNVKHLLKQNLGFQQHLSESL